VIPLGLKIVYTVFVCALVPIYWRQYGPANFVWFSDIALLALVPALWLENALLVSMMAVSVVFFEALWNADFFFHLSTGKSLIGLSAYMFDPKIPLFTRGLSCFHIVLPLLNENFRLRSMDLTCPELRPYGFGGGGGAGFFGAA
jgi:hypothetical protein